MAEVKLDLISESSKTIYQKVLEMGESQGILCFMNLRAVDTPSNFWTIIK